MSPLNQWLLHKTGFLPAPEELRHWQMRQVRETLRHAAASSPFYADKLEAAAPDSIQYMEDMETLPRTTADELRCSPDSFLCGSRDDVARVVTLQSSGTTGSPKRIFNSAQDLEDTICFFEYGMQLMVGDGDVVLILLPGDTGGGVGALLSDGLARFGARGIAHGPVTNPDETIERMREEGVTAIVGSPAHCNVLAANWQAQDGPRNQLRSALLCWDNVPKAVERNLFRAFGCRAYRHWGMVETGLGGAVTCGRTPGMHVREADLFVEITDPETGKQLPDGESGELVVTTLSRKAMPLVRYRTGDISRILPGDCPCGSPLRRLGPIEGRLARSSCPIPLSTLDEVIYSIDGICDYHAQYTCDPEPHLEITLHHVDSLHSNPLNHLKKLLPDYLHGIQTTLTPAQNNGPAVAGLGKRAIQTAQDA